MKASHFPTGLEAALRQPGLPWAGRLSHLEGLPSLLPRRWVCLSQPSLPPSAASRWHSLPGLSVGISRSIELISWRLLSSLCLTAQVFPDCIDKRAVFHHVCDSLTHPEVKQAGNIFWLID